ncbi:signal transduction histidine kinase [Companilactobacillus crustorum]|uniref:histidine kinase n=4 Tax=Companilactobacillus TaxID=2767879 RepID=A0A837RGX9_9LACO|nr:integral membrane sensor signal transduction histidine kinase [Companilactobacillus crustorum JCM 15951]KRO17776.1 integral membrane sensor signal transduction histidine kinase [Companilactobacillus crustorum]GEO77641.1 signal transduction histidine kinase [Companilactobacillus crustorum]
MASFAILFITLGLIIFNLFQSSTYKSIDKDIRNQVVAIKKQPNMQKQTNPDPHDPNNHFINSKPDPKAPFQASILVFNNKGKLTNKSSLGNRYSVLKNIKLNKRNVNLKQTIVVNNMNFRSILIKVSKKNNNPMYAGNYVLIMQNIDTQIQAIQNFEQILIVTFFIFWIIALVISYFLAKINMLPIVKSWKQQTEFVNDAAHELRTPLTIIQGKLEYMLTKPNKKIIDEAEAISVSLDEVNRLNSLTNNLLVLARSDSATTKLNFELTKPDFFLKDPIEPFKDIINSQSKVFQINLIHRPTLYLDRDKIKQLLIILLDNATKYTPKNGTIKIYDQMEGSKYQFVISDTGVGVVDKDKNKIFDRFYRVDKSRNTNSGGHGLGLAIAKQIVTVHKGHIYVRNNLPHGSEFVVELPIKH